MVEPIVLFEQHAPVYSRYLPLTHDGYRSIDLFAGIGGIRKGFDNAFHERIHTVFVSEWDKYAQETYRANYQDSFSIAGDITKIRAEDIAPFDICLAGFPCQAFSLAGHRLGFKDETRGTLFFEIEAILRKHQPRAFFLENVKGLAIHDKGRTLLSPPQGHLLRERQRVDHS